MTILKKISKKTGTTIRKVVFYLFIILVIEILGGWLVHDFKFLTGREKSPSIERLRTTDTIPFDYKSVLNLKGNSNDRKQKYFLFNTIESNLRYPTSDFIYDQKYYLEIVRLTGFTDFSLSKAIQISQYQSAIPYGVPYRVDDQSEFRFQYRADVATKPKKLILMKIYGQNIKSEVLNDSVACYYAEIKNFSIQFDDDKVCDVFGETENTLFFFNTFQPIEILFLRKKTGIYFLTLNRFLAGSNTNYSGNILAKMISP